MPITPSILETPVKLITEPPKPWHLMFKNDEVTPYLFVVHVIMDILGYPEAKAIEITEEVHDRGRASAGLFTKELAETRADQIMQIAKAERYPLVVTIEKSI